MPPSLLLPSIAATVTCTSTPHPLSLLHCCHLDPPLLPSLHRGHSPLLPPSPPQPPPSLLLPSLAATATSTAPPLPLLHILLPPRLLLSSLPSIAATSTPPLPLLRNHHVNSSLVLPSLYHHRHLHFSPSLSATASLHSPSLPSLLLSSLSSATTTSTTPLPLYCHHHLPSSPPSSPPPPSTLPSSCCLAKDLLFPSLGMNPSSHHWVQASSTRGPGLFSFLFSLEEREAPAPMGRESVGKMGDKGDGDGSPVRWKEREKP